MFCRYCREKYARKTLCMTQRCWRSKTPICQVDGLMNSPASTITSWVKRPVRKMLAHLWYLPKMGLIKGYFMSNISCWPLLTIAISPTWLQFKYQNGLFWTGSEKKQVINFYTVILDKILKGSNFLITLSCFTKRIR